MRAWLSKMIFEKILRWPSAQEVGKKITEETERYNSLHNTKKCGSCGSSNLFDDVTGSEGILTRPHYFYRCRKCGNVQDKSGRLFEMKWEELAKKRIKEGKNGKYRYMILTESQSFILLVLFVIVFIVILFVKIPPVIRIF